VRLTDFYAKYLAIELTRRSAADGLEKPAPAPAPALADAQIDLNPHLVDAALRTPVQASGRRMALLRQRRPGAAAPREGEEPMKNESAASHPGVDGDGVLAALRRARLRAERVALMTGTHLVVVVDGKPVLVAPRGADAIRAQEVELAAQGLDHRG
jgi:hypothetical protein